MGVLVRRSFVVDLAGDLVGENARLSGRFNGMSYVEPQAVGQRLEQCDFRRPFNDREHFGGVSEIGRAHV